MSLGHESSTITADTLTAMHDHNCPWNSCGLMKPIYARLLCCTPSEGMFWCICKHWWQLLTNVTKTQLPVGKRCTWWLMVSCLGTWSFSHNLTKKGDKKSCILCEKLLRHSCQASPDKILKLSMSFMASLQGEEMESSWLCANSQHESAWWHTHHCTSHDFAPLNYLAFPVVSLTIHDEKLYIAVTTTPAITHLAVSHARLYILFWSTARPSGNLHGNRLIDVSKTMASLFRILHKALDRHQSMHVLHARKTWSSRL